MVHFFENTWLLWWSIAFVAVLRSSLCSSIEEWRSSRFSEPVPHGDRRPARPTLSIRRVMCRRYGCQYHASRTPLIGKRTFPNTGARS